MGISFQRSSDFTERRRQGRAPLAIEVFVRERSRSAMAVRLLDLNSFGAMVEGMILIQPDAQVWLRLPGLESLAARPVWTDGTRVGLEFEVALHPAVAARFLPAEGSHAAAVLNARPSQLAADPLLSRREQIMAGIAATDHSPLQRKKQPSGLGMFGRISRTVARQADHRAERRYADAVPQGTALSIEGTPASVLNVSPSGMKIRAALGEKEIGEPVAVSFEGFEEMTGQLVWIRGAEAGIALPPQSIELFDRAAG